MIMAVRASPPGRQKIVDLIPGDFHGIEQVRLPDANLVCRSSDVRFVRTELLRRRLNKILRRARLMPMIYISLLPVHVGAEVL
jgi:hypothetical protein